MSPNTLRIALILRPHGVRGAVKCEPLSDDPKRFIGLKEAYIELHGALKPVQLCVHSSTNEAVLLTVEGCTTVEQANELRNAYICVDRAKAVKLPKYTYFIADLIGCETFDTEGNSFGRVTDVLQTGANDVYMIENGKLMVPALRKVLQSVDTENGKIVFWADVLREVGFFAD